MVQQCLRYSLAVIGLSLLVLGAGPAWAQQNLQPPFVVLNAPATCGCSYKVDLFGNTGQGAGAVTVSWSFIETVDGSVSFVEQHSLNLTSDATGFFEGPTNPFMFLPLPGSCSGHDVTFSTGQISFSFNGTPVQNGTFEINLSDNLSCTPPQGKTFSIGPSSMEGHILIRPGDWVSGGYSIKFVDGAHIDSTVTVTSTLTVPVRCADGSNTQFTVNLGTHDYFVPAANTAWQPTGDANSVLSWAGSALAPDACGGGGVMDNSKGAIFQATVSQNPDTGSQLNWRFKYRDPNAKGKGNVNCLDTTDPRRNKADVCGASWSQTVRDP